VNLSFNIALLKLYCAILKLSIVIQKLCIVILKLYIAVLKPYIAVPKLKNSISGAGTLQRKSCIARLSSIFMSAPAGIRRAEGGLGPCGAAPVLDSLARPVVNSTVFLL
jgi:hypothetical protein